MKIFENRKSLLRRYLIMAIASLTWLACEDDREVGYDPAAGQGLEHADPYLQVVTGFIPFEVGTEGYDLEFNAVNGLDALSKVKMYGVYTDAESGITSEPVLYGEYDVQPDGRTVVVDNLTYAELREGIVIDGEPLGESDEDVFPGSGWSFSFEGIYADGKTLPLGGRIDMVLSKYAGIYTVSDSHYMRIQPDMALFPPTGVANWDGAEVFIGFVNANTLSYNDRWGYFETPGCKWAFSYDETNQITEIILSDGIVCASSAATVATCATPNAFKNLSTWLGVDDICAESMVIIDNNETGEHVIKLTYGYLGGGGYRQFTETLTKKVD